MCWQSSPLLKCIVGVFYHIYIYIYISHNKSVWPECKTPFSLAMAAEWNGEWLHWSFLYFLCSQRKQRFRVILVQHEQIPFITSISRLLRHRSFLCFILLQRLPTVCSVWPSEEDTWLIACGVSQSNPTLIWVGWDRWNLWTPSPSVGLFSCMV